jgi:predicted TIM-barrel fold metal-dependent hydrolase
MIDTNVNLFQWPFRRLAGDDAADLVARLRKRGVTQAWACSFEALLHRDVEGVDARLTAACRVHGPNFLLPFGTVNPKQPDWQEDLRRCQEVHKMPGIRLYPNYHSYTLDDPLVAELLGLAAARRLVVEIALSMEDPRTQYPLMQVPPTSPAPLSDLVKHTPDLRVVVLNGHGAGHRGGDLAQATNVYFDIAMVEGVGGVGRFVNQVGASHVVFGSHFPFFQFGSAALKVREAGLTDEQTQAILEGNARAILKK